MTNNDRLEALKISLPKAPKPVGAYVAYKKTGNLIFISGQVSFNSNGELIKGKVGKDLTTEDTLNSHNQCIINVVSMCFNLFIIIKKIFC